MRSPVAPLAALMAAGALAAGPPPAIAAECVPDVNYLGVPYLDSGELPAGAVRAQAGSGVTAGCGDPATPAPVHRVAGVAPRFAVALPPAESRPPALRIARGNRCVEAPAGRTLICLRALAQRFLAGPSLIAPTSAEAGDIVRVGIHVRNPAARANLVQGIDTLLQQRQPDGTWRSTHTLNFPLPGREDEPPPPQPASDGPAPVLGIGYAAMAPLPLRLPRVEPGLYRLAKSVGPGTGPNWIGAHIVIRP